MAENYLFANLSNVFSLRPAYIYPVEKRKEPNLGYKIWRILYPLLRLLGKTASIKSTQLARAMYEIGLRGAPKDALENKDILNVLESAHKA
ncbi:hypothetical protein [Marinifilum sp.]|uniref:hypothetical protein n=1 Tax=Marinifilum sp. TaxID=2033137 RepID=UPI003BAA82DF